MENSIYAAELNEMRKNYSQKKFTGKLPCPLWMRWNVLYKPLYKGKDRIFSEGNICYGCIIQANENLFRPTPKDDYPAMVVYSHDESVQSDPEVLGDIARTLFSYKETPLEQVPEHLREIVAEVQDEHSSECFEKVLRNPEDGTEITICVAIIMVYRRYIPSGMLKGSVLPMIALPGHPDMVHVLPKDYWTQSFIEVFWD